MDYKDLCYDPARDYAPVDVLPIEAFDLALQMETGYTPVDCVATNKTFNGASIGEVVGRVTDAFLEADLCRALHRGSVSSTETQQASENTENENSQKPA